MKAIYKKQAYAEAELEILLLRCEDVIATSSGVLDPDGTGDDGNLGSWTPPEW